MSKAIIECSTCGQPATHEGAMPTRDGGTMPWYVCNAHVPIALIAGIKPKRIAQIEVVEGK